LGKSDAAARALSDDLRPLLGGWFDVPSSTSCASTGGRRPHSREARGLRGGARHPLMARSQEPARQRRRCFAFFHPRMPEEPLIFVEVALVDGLAGSVQRLLDSRGETSDPGRAKHRDLLFDSNCQQGLAGISFGNFLIKRVAERLAKEMPNLKTFATLSPVPACVRYIDRRLKDEGDQAMTQNEIGSLVPVISEAHGAAAVRSFSTDRTGGRCCRRQGAVPILTRSRPPTSPSTDEKGRALDRVAHFHLGNGAIVERLNWWATPAPMASRQATA